MPGLPNDQQAPKAEAHPAGSARPAPGHKRAPWSDPLAQLVVAAQSGDTEALGQIWCQCRQFVTAVLLACAPRADIEDLCQEVATRLCAKLGELREPAAFHAWLRTVVRNVARTTLRHRGAAPTTVQLEPEHATHARSGETVEARDELEYWIERIRGLPCDYREPLLLRSVEGMSQAAIATTLGLTEAAVETRLARARRMLRQSAHARSACAEQPFEVQRR